MTDRQDSIPGMWGRARAGVSCSRRQGALILLSFTFVLALIVAYLVFVPTTQNEPVNANSELTWNMQGDEGSNASKWNAVATFAAGGPNISPHPVIALQQVGHVLPSAAVFDSDIKKTVAGKEYIISVYNWRVGVGQYARNAYLYYMKTDPGGGVRNLAMVTLFDPAEEYVVPPQPMANKQGEGLAAFGVSGPIVGTMVYWVIDAEVTGDDDANDAQNLLNAITATPTSNAYFTVLGGFNRRPGLLNVPSSWLGLTHRPTHMLGFEADYLVSNSLPSTWDGLRIGNAQSSHLPVEFGHRYTGEGGLAQLYPIHPGNDLGKCVYAPSGKRAFVTACDDLPDQDFVFSSKQLKRRDSTNTCLDVQGGGTADGTPVLGYSCNNGVGQQWEVRVDGTLFNPNSNRCLDSTAGGSAGLVIQTCNTTAYPLNQQFVLPWAGMAVNANGLCLDSQGGSTTNSNPVLSAVCDPDGRTSSDQLWALGESDALVYKGKCLDIQGNATANGSPVILYDCHGGEDQRWIPRDDGTVFNPNSGRCLVDDPYHTTELRQLTIYDCQVASPPHFPLPAGSWWDLPL